MRYTTIAALAVHPGLIGICLALGTAHATTGGCPQARSTMSVPAVESARTNPLPGTPDHVKAGRAIYAGNTDTDACALCHGSKGDGRGKLAKLYTPPPRNFTCAATMRETTDGQLFWAIRHGVVDSGMPPHHNLTETQIWQVVHYLRSLAAG
jgi:mono/diheme cytochrome c family protein